MNERSKTLAAGVVALAKSTVLLAGVPLAIVRLWTLVPGVSRPTDLRAWHGTSLLGHAVLAAVGLLWLAASVSLGRDLVLALRGRAITPSSWSARWAVRIAGLALLASAGSALGSSVAGAAVTPIHATAGVALAQVRTAGGFPATTYASPASPIDRAGKASLYIVREGDTLSSIAERELGDEADWPVLARLNMGRIQPDGRRLTDPSLIYPGWRIEVPASEASIVAEMQPGRLGVPESRVAAIAADVSRSAVTDDTRALLRAHDLRSLTEQISSSRSAAPNAPRDKASEQADSGHRESGAAAGARPIRELEELAMLGVGLLAAAGVARRLRLLRRVGECLRRPGERIPAPPASISRSMATIDPLAEVQLLDWIDAANRALWRACAALPHDAELPEIRLVRAGPDGIAISLLRPIAAAPDGFIAIDGGATWTLDASLGLDELREMTADCGRYEPALVPVGDAEDATYLVALGPGRRIALESSDGSSVDSDLGAILVALRTLPWASELQVELVGVAPPAPAEHCYRLNASSAAELAELARRESPDRRDRLTSTWSTETLVVVGDTSELDGPDERLLDELARIVGTITIGGPGSIRLVATGDAVTLEPDGIVLTRSAPSHQQLALVDSLLTSAVDEPTVPSDEAGGAAAPSPARASELDTVGSNDQEYEGEVAPDSVPIHPGPIEIRILGRMPTVDGWVAPPSSKDRSRVVEALGYLALHEHTATTDRLRDAVFGRGERVASLGRVHNVLSAARAALGSRPDGRSYLPASSGGRYLLDPSVTCDWTRFETLRRAAIRAEPESAVELLVAALSLVDGVPLAELASGWEWLLAEGTQGSIVSSIVDGAHHLATLATARSDLELARWALARGTSVEPWSEILARDAMVVADLAGDLDGVRRVWHELERALDALDGNEPSPESRALYEELTSGAASAASPSGEPGGGVRSARKG